MVLSIIAGSFLIARENNKVGLFAVKRIVYETQRIWRHGGNLLSIGYLHYLEFMVGVESEHYSVPLSLL